MTRVTIVSRTRMGDLVCVGGLTRDDFRNVRLLPPSGAHGHHVDAPYAVGEVWEMDLQPVARPEAPHVEDVLVIAQQPRPVAMQMGLGTWLASNTHPWVGGAEVLFEGKLRLSPSGRAHIARGAVSSMSVGFWVPSRDLVLEDGGQRYPVPWRHGTISVKFVGDAVPEPRIEAGTLVRVSLSRWFRSPSGTDGCWLQVSGAYPVPGSRSRQAPQPPGLFDPVRAGDAEAPADPPAPGDGPVHPRPGAAGASARAEFEPPRPPPGGRPRPAARHRPDWE